MKYIISALIGYALFAAISGRLNPMTLNHHSKDRASWYLGLWVGLSTSLVLALTIYMASSLPSGHIATLIQPSATLLACLLAPAVIFYLYTLKDARKHRNTTSASNFDWAMSEDDLHQASKFDADVVAEHPLDATLLSDTTQTNTLSEVSPAYLETAEINRLSHDSTQEAMNDADTFSDMAQDSDQSNEFAEWERKLRSETQQREETEKHLRVTRKALAILEAETRDLPQDSTDQVIELEESLAETLDKASALEADAFSEKALRIDYEQRVAKMKLRLVAAKTEIRRSAAARAKALGTANKSIAFARQSVQIRSRIEQELKDVQATVDNQQQTISSLIRALEKEKRRTDEEITSIARQLVLHEKQLRTRRSLEAVARSVENKLTSRLVKKVARARPLISDVNHGEPN